MAKYLKELEEGPKAEILIDLLRTTQKNQTEKRQAMMEYVDFVSRNSPPFTTDQHCK